MNTTAKKKGCQKCANSQKLQVNCICGELSPLPTEPEQPDSDISPHSAKTEDIEKDVPIGGGIPCKNPQCYVDTEEHTTDHPHCSQKPTKKNKLGEWSGLPTDVKAYPVKSPDELLNSYNPPPEIREQPDSEAWEEEFDELIAAELCIVKTDKHYYQETDESIYQVTDEVWSVKNFIRTLLANERKKYGSLCPQCNDYMEVTLGSQPGAQNTYYCFGCNAHFALQLLITEGQEKKE